ncbi:hypothetical protein BZA77DRAFT_106096 [Pyronema omphalodes]|nr:hypothetical protein BZA77DRAFT_106096 [Pyronema omphalodes]
MSPLIVTSLLGFLLLVILMIISFEVWLVTLAIAIVSRIPVLCWMLPIKKRETTRPSLGMLRKRGWGWCTSRYRWNRKGPGSPGSPETMGNQRMENGIEMETRREGLSMMERRQTM